jgi:hypothetical protein
VEQRLAVWQIPQIWSEHRKSMLELVDSDLPGRKLKPVSIFKDMDLQYAMN